MRLAVFIFSFYLVFGQIYYAHSALPVLGGAVAVARGVGTLIKGGKVLKGSMWGAGAVYAYCTATPANKKRCKELGGEAVELILGDDDDSSDANCKIIRLYDLNYERKKHGGEYSLAYKRSGDGHNWYRTKDSLMSEIQARYEQFYTTQEMQDRYPLVDSIRFPPNDRYSQVVSSETFKKDFKRNCDNLQVGQYYLVHEFLNGKKVAGGDGGSREWYYQGFLGAYKMSDDMAAEEQAEKEKELWDKLKDKLSDDDITNIVNNYGDDIDIDKYCASGATCYFLENEFEKEINNNDYDIDKIDDKNCNTRNGKIYSCPNAKKKKDRDDDDDGQTNNDDDKKDDDGQTNNDDKDKDGIKIPNIPNFTFPRFCTWAKHVCDFTDWVKEPPKIDNNDDYKPEIKELSELGNQDINKSYYNASGVCPAPVAVNLTYGTVYMSYQNYCDFAIRISPLVIALAYILGAYIVARGR